MVGLLASSELADGDDVSAACSRVWHRLYEVVLQLLVHSRDHPEKYTILKTTTPGRLLPLPGP